VIVYIEMEKTEEKVIIA